MLVSGIIGVVTYLIIDGVTHWLEKHEEERAKALAATAKGGGLAAFLYLELIDASFSLDGVLGAFALSKDIVIITIGLSIGAMFVRSLTIMLVEKKTLNKYLYLEHGAHWAIGASALIMFASTFKEINERSKEHTSELQSHSDFSYAVFCLELKIRATMQISCTHSI